MHRPPKNRDWRDKFLCAFRGLRVGSVGQSSFFVHLPMACFVLAAAAQLKVTTIEWCLLVAVHHDCDVGRAVINAALETMARSITSDFPPPDSRRAWTLRRRPCWLPRWDRSSSAR